LKTIQGVLTEAIQDLLGSKVRVCGASRTDAGVSALGQAALMQIDSPIPTENLAAAITDRLPDDIAVVEAVEVPHGFDIIGAAKNKLYCYTIFTGKVRPVLQIKHCWHVPAKLDTAAMAKAAKMLVGKKDFKSFASAADQHESSVRTIFRCDVVSSRVPLTSLGTGVREASCEKEKMDSCSPPARGQVYPCESRGRNDNTQYAIRNTQYENDWIYVDVEGDSFLYNMVRNIVGTLVEVGIGRWKPEKIKEILEAKDRTAAGPIAPAGGLCLIRIEY
ncbi:MAG: tRNA pseudouridine synthase A, partial [Sedimentisphaerales bacterium]